MIVFSSYDFGELSNTNRTGGPDLYLRAYPDGRELPNELSEYFRFYNQNRKHQSLDYKTLREWYTKGVERGKSTILLLADTILN